MTKIVKIVYLDHVQVENEDYMKAEPIPMVIYGELVNETDDYITVLSYYETKDKFLPSEPENFSMTIIKSCIIERKELKEVE